MPQTLRGDATHNTQTLRSVEMGPGEGLQNTVSTAQSPNGRAIAGKAPGSHNLRNKQSLDYVVKTGLAGGLAGCAV